MTPEACVFCGAGPFRNTSDLVVHLAKEHRKETVRVLEGGPAEDRPIGRQAYHRLFRVYVTNTTKGRQARVLCVCGERYSVNTLTTHDVMSLDDEPDYGRRFSSPPLALEVYGLFDEVIGRETDSFIAHLKREGGFAKHLEDVKIQALLDRIARHRLD